MKISCGAGSAHRRLSVRGGDSKVSNINNAVVVGVAGQAQHPSEKLRKTLGHRFSLMLPIATATYDRDAKNTVIEDGRGFRTTYLYDELGQLLQTVYCRFTRHSRQ